MFDTTNKKTIPQNRSIVEEMAPENFVGRTKIVVSPKHSLVAIFIDCTHALDMASQTISNDKLEDESVADEVDEIPVLYARSTEGENNGEESIDKSPTPSEVDFEPAEGREAPIKLPLQAGDALEIFMYRGHDGEIKSGLSLTRNMISQLNTVFRCEHKIRVYTREMREVENREQELERMIAEMREQIHLPTSVGNTERSKNLPALADVENTENELFLQKATIREQMDREEEKLELPKAQLFRDLRNIMADHQLLEPIPDDDEHRHSSSDLPDTFGAHQRRDQAKNPTRSEIARYAAADAREAALEHIRDKEIQLQHAQRKVDGWKDYYNEKYQEFRERVADGRMLQHISKSYFDGLMLQSEVEATGNLIRAENELEAAKGHARAVGAVINDIDQESNFGDNADNGYRESIETSFIANVDRDRIAKWLRQADDWAECLNECDDWDAKTVGLCDSVSVVAEGKDRKRIDRWQSMCEMLEMEILGEGAVSSSRDLPRS